MIIFFQVGTVLYLSAGLIYLIRILINIAKEDELHKSKSMIDYRDPMEYICMLIVIIFWPYWLHEEKNGF